MASPESGAGARPAAENDQGFLLDAYAARSCVIKTWNKFSPRVRLAPSAISDAPDEGLREVFAGRGEDADAVLDRLLSVCTQPVVDLRPLQTQSSSEQAAACWEAMARGVPVIVAGLLPADHTGHRTGRPNLLVRGADTDEERAGYHPVKICRHQVSEPSTTIKVHSIRSSSLAQPALSASRTIEARKLDEDERDLLPLAHYWRLLAAAGHAAPGVSLGGLVGTETRLSNNGGAQNERGITWVDLDEPLLRSSSRSDPSGWRKRSALERYDHEQGFRVQMAEAALAGHEPLVPPIRVPECDSCQWWEVCAPSIGPDDIYQAKDADLDVREMAALRSLGVRTFPDLASVSDLDELMERYLPLVQHQHRPKGRLLTNVRRARLIASGADLARITTGPIQVPAAEVEVDLDIETDDDRRAYLWGFLVDDRRTDDPPYYREFSLWEDLTPDSEAELAARAMGWLRELTGRADSVCVYHYSPYERTAIRQINEAQPDPRLQWGVDHSAGWCDLSTIVSKHWCSPDRLGLKQVATRGAGFSWRDEEPSGFASIGWFDQACHGATEEIRAKTRQRVLEYNEDDVRATWRVRRWLREQT